MPTPYTGTEVVDRLVPLPWTGDPVDGQVEALRDEVKPLAELRASLGVFYVTGNHEYYHGGPAWAAEVVRLGLTVLQNEHRVVKRDGARLIVAGVTDHDAGHVHPSQARRPDVALHGAPRRAAPAAGASAPQRAARGEGRRVDGPPTVRAHPRYPRWAGVPLHVFREDTAAGGERASHHRGCVCAHGAPATRARRCAWGPRPKSSSSRSSRWNYELNLE